MYLRRIVIAPWLELREPLQFGSVELLPKEFALERWPEAAACIELVTSYFYDGNQHPRDEHKEDFLRGESVPMVPVRAKLTIVNYPDDGDIGVIETAFNALAFASMAKANDSLEYCNATVFNRGIQRMDGSPFVAHRTRRRTGGQLNAFDPRTRIETKPTYCGRYVRPDDDLLAALESAVFRPDALALREALGVLAQATLDSDNVPPEIESSFYALVAERLLADRSRKADIRQRLDAARVLLGPLVPKNGNHIVNALDVTNDRRNGVWHSGPGRSRKREVYEGHAYVPFNLVAFRAVEACIIAKLVAINALDSLSDSAIKVRVIEEWIGGIAPVAVIPTSIVERIDCGNAAKDISRLDSRAKLNAAVERFMRDSAAQTTS